MSTFIKLPNLYISLKTINFRNIDKLFPFFLTNLFNKAYICRDLLFYDKGNRIQKKIIQQDIQDCHFLVFYIAYNIHVTS